MQLKFSSLVKTLLVCLSFWTIQASACSCASFSLTEQVNQSDNIFIADVTDIKTLEKGDVASYFSGSRRGYFNVTEILKGSVQGLSFIESADQPVCCICQSQIKKGTYIIFNNNGSLINYSRCGFTKPISSESEIPEVIKALSLQFKPTETFSGVYDRDNLLFVNDDGTTQKVYELLINDYSAELSRVSFEGLKLNENKLLAVNLLDELSLSEEEIKLFHEMRSSKQ